MNDRGGHHVCDKFSEITKIRLRVKTVSRTKFYLTKKNSLNVLFSWKKNLPEGGIMKTKNSVVSYVHKNFVHLHQSILKENIGLTMQLLIFESKASREKNSSVQPKIFQIFLFLFFQKANQIITLLIFIKKFFFNFIKSFFLKIKIWWQHNFCTMWSKSKKISEKFSTSSQHSTYAK